MKKVLTSFISIVILATNVLPISPFADNMNNKIGITNDSDDYFYSDNDYQCSLNNDNTINIELYVGSDTHVSIPSYIDNKPVTSIGDYAFAGCSITNLTIPDSVTSIGDGAFRECYSLTSVTISDSVTSIGKYAFEYCSNIKDVYFYGSKDEWNRIACYLYSDATIHYNYDPNHKHRYTS